MATVTFDNVVALNAFVHGTPAAVGHPATPPHNVPASLAAAYAQALHCLNPGSTLMVRVTYGDAAPAAISQFEAGVKPANWAVGVNTPDWRVCPF